MRLEALLHWCATDAGCPHDHQATPACPGGQGHNCVSGPKDKR